MNGFDMLLFPILNGIVGKNIFIDGIVVFAGSPLIWIMVVGAVLVLWGDKLFSKIFSLIGAIIFSEIIIQTIHFFYNRPRPFEVMNILRQLLSHDMGASFPSGHATVSFAIATTVFLWRPKWGIWFLIVAFAVSTGRVIGGVHWPSDIVAGAAVGVFSAMTAYWTLRKNKK